MAEMLTASAGLRAERNAIRTDLFAGRIPKRVLVYSNFSLDAACGYAGLEMMDAQYDLGVMGEAFDAICSNFYADAFPLFHTRFPLAYQLLGTRNWVVTSKGDVQHPEISVMEPGDYDDFTKVPYHFIVEKLLPRACAALDTDPVNRSLALSRAFAAHTSTMCQYKAMVGRLIGKHGYGDGFANHQILYTPFDYIADQLRGFKGITMDIRRMPDKVKAACEAVLPMLVDLATPIVPQEGLITLVPLHMAPFINMKQFEELYWPTLWSMVEQLAQKGVACTLYAEQDFTRYAEYLMELPASTNFLFENGDAAHLKSTVGKQHVFGGFYDPTITLVRSKEACIDEAKRLLDVCMKGGRFFFTFDRAVIDIKSVDVSKLQAVLEWVRDHANY